MFRTSKGWLYLGVILLIGFALLAYEATIGGYGQIANDPRETRDGGQGQTTQGGSGQTTQGGQGQTVAGGSGRTTEGGQGQTVAGGSEQTLAGGTR